MHLCYGDFGARHFIEPVDAARLVFGANEMTRAIARPITYIHLPIPFQWTQAHHYQPLRELRLAPETELYLGLVHAADGAAGTARRIALARACVAHFGIATECGIARARKPDLVERTLHLQAEIASQPPRVGSSRCLLA